MSSGQPVVIGRSHEPRSGVVCHHLQKLCLALKRLGLILVEARSTQDDVSNGARSTMGNPAHYHETIIYVVSQEYAIVTHLLVCDTQVRAIGGFQRLFAGSYSLIRLDLDLATIHNLLSAADGGSCSTLTWRFVHGLPNTPLPVQKPQNGPLRELSIEYSSYTCREVEFDKMISWLAGNIELEMAKKVLGYGESFSCQVDARFIEKLRLHLNSMFEVSPAIWERWSASVIDLTLGGSNAVALLSFELVYPINPRWAFDVMSTWEPNHVKDLVEQYGVVSKEGLASSAINAIGAAGDVRNTPINLGTIILFGMCINDSYKGYWCRYRYDTTSH
ncbi:hypothetical protein EDD18DRAFT_1100452 [Armillaria luteobubalina]|uniref:Uncharacterized protein n=1 Tax=Armillaria luteobubalina TaxID=153913 RepID=A0AA39QFG6_9AGAR|nr:hypothetical protein EDD18DRAFT_1100452 [Armillaria luteobubalina]